MNSAIFSADLTFRMILGARDALCARPEELQPFSHEARILLTLAILKLRNDVAQYILELCTLPPDI
jgi:hypothetical protein